MRKKSRLRELLEALIAACCLVFLAKVFLFFPTKVEGASMVPTLHEGDKIIVSKVVTYIHPLFLDDVYM
jgi:signal peptidase I